MKQLFCALTIAIACLGVVAAPVQGADGACVSPREYRQVYKGMPMRRVHRLFDTSGRRVVRFRYDRFTSEIRRYRGCARRSAVSVAYGNGRVRSKSAYWGR